VIVVGSFRTGDEVQATAMSVSRRTSLTQPEGSTNYGNANLG
jgi:hypothetical protein